ncbi:lipocalin family protein [Stenotrophomonas tumulicola]|uniref:Outer membrane lipoprotein Blc n=1 Tax=Stenotrophomonas tumulicola TaxID=1685415 RepID=A0A7W3FMH6_9GAMM|nr:lipocalin family protein [Stenotrophomonas tumulicola]MBA8682273.1 lipocalin family protein [Stenotrophomonas tumulicola]
MTAHPDLKTVPDLKLPRYLGTWYEIARLPMRHEPEGCTDVSAHYSLQEDGNVRVHNRCRMDGVLEEAIGEACVVDNDSARLAVSFLPKGLRWLPFTKGDYWVIQVAPDYSVSLVGSPDREYLWLLARTPQLDKTVRDHYLATARQQGFDLSKLIDTPHTGNKTA